MTFQCNLCGDFGVGTPSETVSGTRAMLLAGREGPLDLCETCADHPGVRTFRRVTHDE